MKVVSVSFLKDKREYYYKATVDDLQVEDYVIVKTEYGQELAIVKKIIDKLSSDNLLTGISKASEEDVLRYQANYEKSKIAYQEFNYILNDFKDLDMHLIDAWYNLDNTRLTFCYSSDYRVDFRELLKVLALHFKTRIELRQVGARDRAKKIGGLGPCGMETCCTRFLKEFENISITMAKNQYLSLNPTKISGLCGRLLCCLKYENEYYNTQAKTFPRIGKTVCYDGKNYRVTGANILMDLVKIEGDGTIKMISKEELEW